MTHSFNEYIELDLLTLKDISKQAGKPIDTDEYRQSLEQAASNNCLFDARTDGRLDGYSTLKALGEGRWHVLMFVTHPKRRGRRTLTTLFAKIIKYLKENDGKVLVSNVLRGNHLSIAFHQKLGFRITREAPQGFEFTLNINSLDIDQISRWCH